MLVALLLVPAHFELISIFRVRCTLAGNAYYNSLEYGVQICNASAVKLGRDFLALHLPISVTLFEFWTQNDGKKIPQTNLMQKSKDKDCNSTITLLISIV